MENTHQNPEGNALTDIFGELTYSYTRQQAIADGMLVDVSKTAKEASWRYPVAVTVALWAVIETIPRRFSHEDVKGRLWDVVWMAAMAAMKSKEGSSRFVYELILHREGTRRKMVQLVCDCGPGDNGEPVVTIGFAEDF